MDNNVAQKYKNLLNNISKTVKFDINKGKALPVGTVRDWNGKLHKKQVDGSWKFIGYANEQNKQKEQELEGYDGRPEKLKEIENNIKNKKIENFHAMTEYGTKIYEKEGDKKSVYIDAEEGTLRDTIITHNHPSMVNEPENINNTVSLSRPDILLACKHNVREVRAVGTDGYIYSLKKGDYDDWGTNVGFYQIQKMHKEAKQLVKSRFQRKVSKAVREYGENSKEADEAVLEANTNDPHEALKMVADELGLEYNVYKNNS